MPVVFFNHDYETCPTTSGRIFTQLISASLLTLGLLVFWWYSTWHDKR